MVPEILLLQGSSTPFDEWNSELLTRRPATHLQPSLSPILLTDQCEGSEASSPCDPAEDDLLVGPRLGFLTKRA